MITGTDVRRIIAIFFELVDDDDHLTMVIAWLKDSGNGDYLMPANPDKTLLDVAVGDVVIHQQSDRYTVRRLKLYCTTECRDDRAYSEIVSWREWEGGGG